MGLLLFGTGACSIDSTSDAVTTAERAGGAIDGSADSDPLSSNATSTNTASSNTADDAATMAFAESATANTADGRSCEADSFPGDTEFRELACQVQWTQLDLLAERSPMDPTWLDRETAALAMYTTDRQRAITELQVLLAEMIASVPNPGVAPAAPEVAPGTALTAGLEDCVIEIAQLMLKASSTGDPNPGDTAQWQAAALEVEALANTGDLAGAEAAACDLRDMIEASLAG